MIVLVLVNLEVTVKLTRRRRVVTIIIIKTIAESKTVFLY